MKKTLLITCLIFITFFSQAQSEYYYNIKEPDVSVEPILYLNDASQSLGFRGINNINEEIDYIKYNVSNINVIYNNNNVYISWNVCDDLTRSLYVVKKTTDNINYKTVGVQENIPCNPHLPLLYSLQDKNVILDKPHFYILYKILEDGSMIHIITMILPKNNSMNTASTN